MASTAIYNKNNGLAVIKEKNKKVLINDISNGNVKISEVLPFRVKFVNIGISSYNSTNPAPIGLAIIGLNNYIL